MRLAAAILWGCAPPALEGGPTLRERFGDHPYLAPLDAPPTIALLAGGEVPSTAEACGACHPDHFAEWRGATHAGALADLQYLAELSKPGQPRWLCLNCHVPTRPQRPEHLTLDSRLARAGDVTAVSTTPEPTFDPARTAEAVGCATCHVRRAADGSGEVVGPRGSGRAPHRVRVDREALHAVCEQCHSPGAHRLTPTFTCWFETREELEAGPQAGTSCPTCHMPTAERSPALGAPPATVRRHLWHGGGVPKTAAGYDRLVETGWTPGLDVDVALGPLRVSLTNARAGHRLPTGDPERHLRVEVRAVDSAGATLAAEVVRIGQRWDWGDEVTGRPAVRLDDDRLLPGETRVLTPALPLAGAAAVVVEVRHVRLTAENAAGMVSAALPPDVRALVPEADPARIADTYPLSTTIFRETVPLDGGPRLRAPLAELLAASRAELALPLAERGRRSAVPAEAPDEE